MKGLVGIVIVALGLTACSTAEPRPVLAPVPNASIPVPRAEGEPPLSKILKCPGVSCLLSLGGELVGEERQEDGSLAQVVRIRYSGGKQKTIYATYEPMESSL